MAGRTGKPVTRVPAFWEASALVPLCVRQGMTPRAIALYKTYDAVVWWATPVEIASALARLVRMKQLNSSDWAKARKLATALADAWSVIQPSDAVRAKAIQLVDRYDLRAADSFQLAAALEWCEHTWDSFSDPMSPSASSDDSGSQLRERPCLGCSPKLYR